MKNLNSKKARQEISGLILNIQAEDIMIHHYLEEMSGSTAQNDWEIHKANFDRAGARKNRSIVELVEVYGIHHVHYENAIEERAEEQAA
tara:strand:+ start:234 stop:500 length:267 start_codon:yes stop_codon:yes gene_type:complete